MFLQIKSGRILDTLWAFLIIKKTIIPLCNSWIFDDYSELGATRLVEYYHLISQTHSWNNLVLNMWEDYVENNYVSPKCKLKKCLWLFSFLAYSEISCIIYWLQKKITPKRPKLPLKSKFPEPCAVTLNYKCLTRKNTYF